MQFGRAVAAIVVFLAPVSNAVGFMGPRHASLVEHKLTHEEMPTTKHDKDAGGDYNKGSPLYEKQEKRKKEGKVAKPEPAQTESVDGGLLTVPSSEKASDPSHWAGAYGEIYGNPQKYWKVGVTYFFSYVIFWVLIAAIWLKCCKTGSPYRWSESHSDRANDFQDFNHGLFSLEHTSDHHFVVCCCSFFCIPLRLADTYSKTPMPISKSFWAALLFVVCLFGLSPLTGGWSSLIFLCVAVYLRQRIRKKYSLEYGGMTWCGDFLRWFCCPFCAIAQEARQLDFTVPGQKEGFKVAQ